MEGHQASLQGPAPAWSWIIPALSLERLLPLYMPVFTRSSVPFLPCLQPSQDRVFVLDVSSEQSAVLDALRHIGVQVSSEPGRGSGSGGGGASQSMPSTPGQYNLSQELNEQDVPTMSQAMSLPPPPPAPITPFTPVRHGGTPSHGHSHSLPPPPPPPVNMVSSHGGAGTGMANTPARYSQHTHMAPAGHVMSGRAGPQASQEQSCSQYMQGAPLSTPSHNYAGRAAVEHPSTSMYPPPLPSQMQGSQGFVHGQGAPAALHHAAFVGAPSTPWPGHTSMDSSMHSATLPPDHSQSGGHGYAGAGTSGADTSVAVQYHAPAAPMEVEPSGAVSGIGQSSGGREGVNRLPTAQVQGPQSAGNMQAADIQQLVQALLPALLGHMQQTVPSAAPSAHARAVHAPAPKGMQGNGAQVSKRTAGQRRGRDDQTTSPDEMEEGSVDDAVEALQVGERGAQVQPCTPAHTGTRMHQAGAGLPASMHSMAAQSAIRQISSNECYSGPLDDEWPLSFASALSTPTCLPGSQEEEEVMAAFLMGAGEHATLLLDRLLGWAARKGLVTLCDKDDEAMIAGNTADGSSTGAAEQKGRRTNGSSSQGKGQPAKAKELELNRMSTRPRVKA